MLQRHSISTDVEKTPETITYHPNICKIQTNMHTKQRKHNQLTKATRPKTKQKNQNHKQRQLCYHGAYRL